MAHRIITQVVMTGSRVLGRAFSEAWKQASASQKYAAAGARAGNGTAGRGAHDASGITLEEACRILDVPPPKGGQADMEKVGERFKRLFDTNEPKNGGSFYLQSKILRARQRIEAEVKGAEEKKQMEKEMKSMPKVYKK